MTSVVMSGRVTLEVESIPISRPPAPSRVFLRRWRESTGSVRIALRGSRGLGGRDSVPHGVLPVVTGPTVVGGPGGPGTSTFLKEEYQKVGDGGGIGRSEMGHGLRTRKRDESVSSRSLPFSDGTPTTDLHPGVFPK